MSILDEDRLMKSLHEEVMSKIAREDCDEAEKVFRKDASFLTWLLIIPLFISYWSKLWGLILLITFAIYILIEIQRIIQTAIIKILTK